MLGGLRAMDHARAAEIRPAESLSELATAINAEHQAGEADMESGFKRFQTAGLLLFKAKSECGHGNWLAWVKNNLKFGVDRRRQLAQRLGRSDLGCSCMVHRAQSSQHRGLM